MNPNQNFLDKIIISLILLFVVKFFVLLYFFNNYPSIEVSFLPTIVLIIFLIIILNILRSSDDSISKSNSNNSGGLFDLGMGSEYLSNKGMRNDNRIDFKSTNNSDVLLREELFNRMRKKYLDLAIKFLEDKKYKKAAFVHMKLLGDNHTGASILEQGKLYNEAAIVYSKLCYNKPKAAECYELGKNYNSAIILYTELHNYEKVGDIYQIVGNKTEALRNYRIVVDNYTQSNQYVKASQILRLKIKAPQEAQEILLKGWECNYDAKNCMNNYFMNFESIDQLNEEIQDIYNHKTKEHQKLIFLDILKHEYNKDEKLQKTTKKIAYEIVSQNLRKNPNIIDELKNFNPDNKLFSKDTSRHKINKKK